ncbi:MAG: CheY-like chemotaxis protein, partial [Planctomycetota bacterium]
AEGILPQDQKRLAEEALEVGRNLLDSVATECDADCWMAPAPSHELRLSSAEPDLTDDPQDVEQANAHILLVDSDQIESRIALGHLSVDGYECTAVADSKQAILALESQPFDLLLLGTQAECSAPTDLIASIRAGQCGLADADLPIILLQEKYSADAVLPGTDDSLSRPLGLGEIDRVIRTWLPPRLRTRHAS